jgi:glycosyltransferase involved in cell wall biosynthesis
MSNTRISAARVSRNALCPCGSGKRYKHCCGGEVGKSIPRRMKALQAHQAGQLTRAESLYRDAMAENAEDVDVWHMLGVVLYQRMRYREALETLWQAAEKAGWDQPQIRRNLGLVLAILHALTANRIQVELQGQFLAWQASLTRAGADDLPLVSVILPAYNHERYVALAIASVLAQTYPNIELIVIDDGSTDGTLARIQSSLSGASIPCRVLTRENRGAPATLNEGAALARGDYLAFLNSDDYFAPDRLARLVEEVARVGAQWGFSMISAVRDSEGSGTTEDEVFEQSFSRKQKACLGRFSNSYAFLTYNIAVSTGNLFVARRLFESLGGFRDYRYNHDWDFCLRASSLAEPVVVKAPLYFYRWHETNTIKTSHRDAVTEAGRMFTHLLERPSELVCANPLSPQWPANRILMLAEGLKAGLGRYVPISELRQFADETRVALPLQHGVDVEKLGEMGQSRGTALVVLGMHRSGTSALTRVLNLCGAYLPDKLRPPKLGANDKGFWEAEDVIDLNERVLGSLGGAWNRTSFALPDAGPVFEEFVHDVQAVVDSEYEDSETILIKDPRIGVLAPLWHAALIASGYRPVYVVPVRNPLEVANSLHARGDMSVREGMALWGEYMQRIAGFAGSGAELMYVRFEDLFLDWRELVGLVSDRLDIRLDIQGRAAEVDAFLDPALRRQTFSEQALDAFPDDSGMPGIRALYRDCLGCCERVAVARPSATIQSASTAE